jgi:hypothetical protein
MMAIIGEGDREAEAEAEAVMIIEGGIEMIGQRGISLILKFILTKITGEIEGILVPVGLKLFLVFKGHIPKSIPVLTLPITPSLILIPVITKSIIIIFIFIIIIYIYY